MPDTCPISREPTVTIPHQLARLLSTVAHPVRAHRDRLRERELVAFALGRECGAMYGPAPRPPRRHLAVVVPIDRHG